MKRRLIPALLLLALLFTLDGCTPQTADPLLKNETTDAPGMAMDVFAATAGEDDAETITVSLYFRYLDEPMLAAETRTVTVPRDQSVEYTVMQALVAGPGEEHEDLTRLLPEDTRVESVVSRNDILFVTLDDGFLNDGVPDDWATDADWSEEAPVLRRLIVQSIAASVTEVFPYTGVQILVHKHGETQTSLRLENDYFLNGTTGLSDPVTRNESLLLTPLRTAETILAAWKAGNVQRLYRYVTDSDKPAQADFEAAFAGFTALAGYTVTGGGAAESGQTATVTAALYLQNREGERAIAAYPLPLVRENGVWKISYTRLSTLANR